MSLHHLFLDGQILAEEDEPVFPLSFSEADLNHVRALRLTPGEHIAVVDGATDYFECEVVSVDKDSISVRIASKLEKLIPPARFTLIQGLAKGDKVDAVVRAATEMGASAIQVAAFQRSVVRLDAKKALARQKRWQAVARSAALQSGCLEVPAVGFARDIPSLLEMVSEMDCVVVFWEEASPDQTLHEALAPAREVMEEGRMPMVGLIVGPEGGIAPAEVEALRALPQVRCASLGRHILRTETAGIVACGLASYELGCL